MAVQIGSDADGPLTEKPSGRGWCRAECSPESRRLWMAALTMVSLSRVVGLQLQRAGTTY